MNEGPDRDVREQGLQSSSEWKRPGVLLLRLLLGGLLLRGLLLSSFLLSSHVSSVMP